MAYEVRFARAAIRDLKRLGVAVRRRLHNRAASLGGNPRPRGAKKLRGLDELYRVRVGDYRLIYQVRDEELLVLVVRARHRRDPYQDIR